MYTEGLLFDLQRFASVTATESKEYAITLPDNSKATVTVSGGTITKVKYGTSELTVANGYYLINGYRVTLSYDSTKSELTSTAVKEETSNKFTTSQVYTVKLTSNDTASQDVTVANNILSEEQSTTTVNGTTVNLTIKDNTLTGTYDKRVEGVTTTNVKSYTLTLPNNKTANVTVDSSSNITVNGTAYTTGTAFKVNNYTLTLTANGGELKTATVAELKTSDSIIGEAKEYTVTFGEETKNFKVADGKFVDGSATFTTTFGTTQVKLTYDSGKLTYVYDNEFETTPTVVRSYTLKDGNTTIAGVTVDASGNIKVNGEDSTIVTVGDKTYSLNLKVKDGTLTSSSADVYNEEFTVVDLSTLNAEVGLSKKYYDDYLSDPDSYSPWSDPVEYYYYDVPKNAILTGTPSLKGYNNGEPQYWVFKINIPDGATVILDNVAINRDTSANFAGLNCLGDATIILAGDNTVNGNSGAGVSPGVSVPENKTLNIKGSGSLTSKGNDAAAIGAGEGLKCGNIVIEGGTINATGATNAAGIGSAENSTCGNITIKGGNITANGGENATGIGAGEDGSTCGDITIEGGTINATGGSGAAGIGSSKGTNNGSTCGNIKITGGTITSTGGQNAAGIGAGQGSVNSTCGNITVESTVNVITSSISQGGSGGSHVGTVTINVTKNDDGSYTGDGTGGSSSNGTPLTAVDSVDTMYSVKIDDNTTVNVTFDSDNKLATAKDSIGNALTVTNSKFTINNKTYTLTLNGEKVNVIEHDVTKEGSTTSNQQVLTLGEGDNAITLYLTMGTGNTISSAKYKVGNNAEETTISSTDISSSTVKIGNINVDLIIENGSVTKAEYPDFSYTDSVINPNNQEITLPTSTVAYFVKIDNDTTATVTFDEENKLKTADTGSIKDGNLTINNKAYTLTLNGSSVDVTQHNVAATITATSTIQTITLTGKDNTLINLGVTLSGNTISSAKYKVGNGGEQTAKISGNKVTIGNIGVELTIEGGKVTKAEYPNYKTEANTVDLSKLTNHYTAQDGDVLTGTLAGNYKISIADGAIVTIKDVTINGTDNSSYQWAGITCNGDATIILEGNNRVTGFYKYYPCIRPHMCKTLTITGTGSLYAESNSNSLGAGIGGAGYEIGCGNIVIDGGTIVAKGGNGAAGIGGGGENGNCGDITIANTVTSVKATKGDGAPNAIGASKYGSCGTVTIKGTTYSAGYNGDDITGNGNGTSVTSALKINPNDQPSPSPILLPFTLSPLIQPSLLPHSILMAVSKL